MVTSRREVLRHLCYYWLGISVSPKIWLHSARVWEWSDCAVEHAPTNLGAPPHSERHFSAGFFSWKFFCVTVHCYTRGRTSLNSGKWKELHVGVGAQAPYLYRKGPPFVNLTLRLAVGWINLVGSDFSSSWRNLDFFEPPCISESGNTSLLYIMCITALHKSRK